LKQDCVLQSTAKKSGAIAAHHRDSPNEDTGFSFVGCVINGTGKILLGRAWGNYSRTIYSYCYLNDIIDPSGWSDWNYPYRQKYIYIYKLFLCLSF
jgi:pectinesterase